MKTLELTAIDLEAERLAERAAHQEPDNSVEMDDLERPVETVQPVTETEPTTYPITVMIDAVRSFYPRKHGKPGTRVVYHNGAADVVSESYADVRAKLNSFNN